MKTQPRNNLCTTTDYNTAARNILTSEKCLSIKLHNTRLSISIPQVSDASFPFCRLIDLTNSISAPFSCPFFSQCCLTSPLAFSQNRGLLSPTAARHRPQVIRSKIERAKLSHRPLQKPVTGLRNSMVLSPFV